MSAITLRYLLFGLLLLHAVGQLMGVVPALGLFGAGGNSGPEWLQKWSVDTGLLSSTPGKSASRFAAILLFVSAFIGFVAGALALQGLVVPHVNWRTILLIASLISMLALILFWNGFVLLFPHKLGNIVVNLFCIFAVYLNHWPDEAMLGIN